MSSLKTIGIDFTIKKKDLSERKTAILHIDPILLKSHSLPEIAKKVLTTQNIEITTPLVITKLPKSDSDLQIEDVAQRSLSANPLIRSVSYSERVFKIFLANKFLLFPILGWMIALIWAFYLPKEEVQPSKTQDLSHAIKRPETTLALLSLIEQHAEKFSEKENFKALALHTKDTREWSLDLLSGKKNQEDLEIKINSLQLNESFSLALGYFRQSGFCPLLLKITKTKEGFSLDSFCVDQMQGPKSPAHRSWSVPHLKNLVDSLQIAIAFAKEPRKEHFSFEIKPSGFFQGALFDLVVPKEQQEQMQNLSSDETYDPSKLLFSSFVEKGCIQKHVGKECKTDRWERVVKHWQKQVLVATPEEEALFKANIKLSLMTALIKEIKSGDSSPQEKWEKLSSLQEEMISLKNTAKKELADPILASSFEKESKEFYLAIEKAFAALTEEMNSSLKPEIFPQNKVNLEGVDTKTPPEQESARLRSLRETIINTKSLSPLKEYVTHVDSLANKKQWQRVSDSVTSLFALLPGSSDLFWKSIPGDQLPSLSSDLMTLAQLQTEAQLHLHDHSPNSYVMYQLQKIYEVQRALLVYRQEHVYQTVFAPKLRGKTKEEIVKLVFPENPGILENLSIRFHGGKRSLEGEVQDYFNLSSSLHKNVKYHNAFWSAKICEKLGIGLSEYLELLVPLPNIEKNLLSPLCLTPDFSENSPLQTDSVSPELKALFQPDDKKERLSLFGFDAIYRGLPRKQMKRYASYFSEYQKKNLPISKAGESLFNSVTLLRLLSGQGDFISETPPSEELLSQIEKELEQTGFRAPISFQEKMRIAQRRKGLEGLEKGRLTFISEDSALEKKMFPHLRSFLWWQESASGEGDIQLIQLGSSHFGYLNPRTNASHNLKGGGSDKMDGFQAALWQNESWKFGLRGKLPIDFLASRLGTRSPDETFGCQTTSSGDKLFFPEHTASWMIRHGFSETPKAFAMIETESPTFEKLPTSSLIALRQLVSGNPKVDSLLIDRFCEDHKEHLEHEEVQRRIEYAAIQSDFTFKNSQKIIEWALSEKRFKTAGFLFFLQKKWNPDALAFYLERLKSPTSSSSEKKYFGTQALTLLQHKETTWSIEEWKLAILAFVSIQSSIEESGSPDLQSSILLRMREQFIPKFSKLGTNDRNIILSQFLPSQELLEWEPDGENWKVKNQPVFFMTSSGVVVSNGSTGPLPDNIALHPDFIQVFGREKRVAKTEISNGNISYHFGPFTIENGAKGLFISQKLDGKVYHWQKLTFQKTDTQLSHLEKAGIWINPETPMLGKIFLGKTCLEAHLKLQKQKEISLSFITNEKGDRLILTKQHPSLLSFGKPESTFLFVDSKNKLQQAVFLDLQISIKKRGSNFFLEDAEKELQLVTSTEEQRYAVQKTTPSLPKYGVLCSDEGRLQIQLYFPTKRATSRPLSLYLEKPQLPGAPSEISGSAMSFLFLSHQAAEEGQFEKAAEYVQKALLSPHNPQENIDYEWFKGILESFEPSSFPAKVWKLKCLIATMQLGQDKLQRAIFDEKASALSLKKAQSATLLWNEILIALSQERKKRRITGILSLTEEENAFLQSLSAKSLTHFLPLDKPKEPEKKMKQPGSIERLATMLLPWDFPLILRKPDTTLSLFTLPVYPTVQELLKGFTSFSKELATASSDKIQALLAHLHTLNIEDMHPRNAEIAKVLMQELLHIPSLSSKEKERLVKDLENVEAIPEEPKAPGKKGNVLEEFAKRKFEEQKRKWEKFTLIFKDLKKQDQSASKAPQEEPTKEEGPSFLELIETSGLTEREKQLWKAHVQTRGVPKDLAEFLKTAQEAKQNFVSLRVISEVEKELRQLLTKKSEPVFFNGLQLPTSFPLDLFKEVSTPPVSKDFTDRLLKAEKDPLVQKELERIAKSELSVSKQYQIKEPATFEKACENKASLLKQEIESLILELGRVNDKNREYSDFERFEMLVDRYVVESHPEEDVLLTRALNALVALKQIEKKSYEGISSAFDLKRLEGLSPRMARAVLVGEYRSGNVSRPFQPKLVEQLVKSEHGAILSPPGSGKTTTILPVVAQVIAKEEQKLPVILLTEELFGLGKEGFDATTKRLFLQAGLVFDFDRNTPKDEMSLAQEVLKIRKAKANGDYIITTVGRLASLENELILKMKERSEALDAEKESFTKQIYWLKELWKTFHAEDVRFIADEIDELYAPTLDYNYALGTSAPIDESIQKSCFDIVDALMKSEESSIQEFANAFKRGNLSKLSEKTREKAIRDLARTLSLKKWGQDYSLFLTDLSQNSPWFFTTPEDATHLREFFSTTLKNMPLSPDSEYGPSESSITVVPKRKTRETAGTRFSDPYELALLHYLYYAVTPPNDDYITAFWVENESIFRQNPIPAPWDQWKSLWKKEIKDLPADLRYKRLTELLKKESSLDQRLYIIKHDILKNKVKLFPDQIRSNAHEILKGCKVCGASGTINPDALSSDFKPDSSLMDRKVMKKTLSELDPITPLECIQDRDLFLQKKAQNPNVVGIIDQAGLQKNKSSLEMAKLLREFSEKKRQILFIHPKFQTKWMWNPNEETPRPFRMVERQPSCLCYFGEAECRGTDWVLPAGEFALIVGPSCNDNDFLQAYGRARRAGIDQKVTLAAELGFLPPKATYFDLMQRVIQNGPYSRTKLNVKSLIRDYKAAVSKFIRASLFSTVDDETLFPSLENRLVQKRAPKTHPKSKNQPIQQFLTESIKAQENLLNTLPLGEKEKVRQTLQAFKREISLLSREEKGLPETILFGDLHSGNTETVQEQQEVQQQEQTLVQESMKFCLDRNKKYPTNHDILRETHNDICSSYWSNGLQESGYTITSRTPNCSWMKRKNFGAKIESSKELKSFLKEREGLQGKSPFLLWNFKQYRDKSGISGLWAGIWTGNQLMTEATMLDPLHAAEMDKLRSFEFPFESEDTDNETSSDIKMLISEQVREFLLQNSEKIREFFLLPRETLGENGLPFDRIEKSVPLTMDSEFWTIFAQSKVESGYWTFSHPEERKGLQRFLRSCFDLSTLETDFLKTRFGKSFPLLTEEERKKIPGWTESDLYKEIQMTKSFSLNRYVESSLVDLARSIVRT